MDVRVHGTRFRESLETRDTAEANEKLLKRVEQLKNQSPDPYKAGKNFSNLTIEQACEAYIELRRAYVSPRMLAFWRECASALGKSVKVKIKAITLAHIKDEYKRLPQRAPNIGYAPTDKEMQNLVLTAKSRPEWQRTFTATILGGFCGATTRYRDGRSGFTRSSDIGPSRTQQS